MNAETNSMGLSIIPVPDGIAATGQLRLSLIVAPATDTFNHVRLAHWPTDVASLCGKLKVAFQATLSAPLVPAVVQPTPALALNSVTRAAVSTWDKLFPCSQMDVLYTVLTTTPPADPAPPAPLATWQYRAGAIVDLLQQCRTGAIGPILQARLVAAEGVNPNFTAAEADRRKPFRFVFDRTLQYALARAFAPAPVGRPEVLYRTGNKEIAGLDLAPLVAQRQERRAEAAMRAAGKQVQRVAGPNEADADTFLDLPSASRALLIDDLLLGAGSKMAAALSSCLPVVSENKEGTGAERIGMRLRMDMKLHALDFAGAFAPARATYAMARSAAGKEGIDTDDVTDGVRAKYTNLLGHPILAKLLRLIVDIEVSLPPGVGDDGFLRVWFEGDEARAAPVAYLIERAGGKATVFRPRARSESNFKDADPADQLSLPLLQGLVDLSQPRFSLVACDVHSLVNSTRVKYQELHSHLLGAGDSADVSPRPPEERSRGIQLVDDESHKTVIARQLHDPSITDPVFAETLVTGYRVFVRRTMPNGITGPWRSLMARSVRYDDIADDYQPGPGEHGPAWKPYVEAGEHEHGALRPLPRTEFIAPNGNTRQVASSHVFTWIGESLGVPARQQPNNLIDCAQGPFEQLHIGFGKDYDYASKDYALPALRIGNRYQFALAPVYLNGGGPTQAEVSTILQANPELAHSGAEGYLYCRAQDVQAPTVVLSPRDRLITRKPLPRNEHADRVVLRTCMGERKDEDTDAVIRYLVPPRVDFDTAEQYGVFDAMGEIEGAFTQFDMDRATGDFDSVSRPQAQGEPERLYVLRPRRDFQGPRQRYFPDPAARHLALAFERDEARPPGFPDMLPPLSFWPLAAGGAGSASLAARPIKLEFRRWPQARLGGRVLSSSEPDDDSDDSGTDLPRLSLQLAPAEEVTLWAWCRPDPADFLRARPQLAWPLAFAVIKSGTALAKGLVAKHGKDKGNDLAKEAAEAERWGLELDDYRAAAALAGAFLTVASSSPGAEKIDAEFAATLVLTSKLLLETTPLTGFNGWRKIVLVHALDKPRTLPWIERIGRDELGIRAIRLRTGTSMADHLQQHSEDEQALALHDAGGSRIFFGGKVHIDRASTRALRVEASWPALDYSVAVVSEADPDHPGRQRFVDRPPRTDRVLFELTNIPRDGGFNGPDVVDLLRDEAERLRELRIQSDFTGTAATAACELDLRLVATSRFSADFTPEPANRPASILGKFEVETRPFRGGVPNSAPAPREQRYLLQVPATVRPPPPVVTRVEWYAPERRWRVGEGHLMVTKHFVPRLYFDRSHRVSGEHELVGLAFLPAGVIASKPYVPGAPPGALALDPIAPGAELTASFTDELARFTAKPDQAALLPTDYCAFAPDSSFCATPTLAELERVTRWGHDPATAAGGKMEALISPARFSGHVATESDIAMPLPGFSADADGLQPSQQVGVLLFKPQLDPENGEWYIDLAIDPGTVHAPFVRLAVVRFQPFGIKTGTLDLRLSTPLLLDPFRVPAPRTVEVLHRRGEAIRTNVYGVSYLRREPFGVTDKLRHLTDTPLQTMELHRRGTANGWVQAFGPDGQALCAVNVPPQPAGPMMCWRCSFDPPATTTAQRYALVIDEVELHVPDAKLDATASDQLTPDDLIARPSFFAVTIELDD